MKLVFAILLVFTSSLKGQISEESNSIKYKKHRIGINYGGSSPRGDYAETTNLSSSGYAKGGGSLELSYHFRFHEYLAVNFLIGSAGNILDELEYQNNLNLLDDSRDITWNIQADPYGIGYSLYGVKGLFGLRDNAYVNPLLGYAQMLYPEIEIIKVDNGEVSRQQIKNTDTEIALMYGLAIGGDMLLADFLSLNLNFSYLQSEFDINYEVHNYSSSGELNIYMVDRKQSYKVVNISIGLGVLF